MRTLIVTAFILSAALSSGAELERGVKLHAPCVDIHAIESGLGSTALLEDEEEKVYWFEATYNGHPALIDYRCGTERWYQRIHFGGFSDSETANLQFRRLVEDYKGRYGRPYRYYNDLELFERLVLIFQLDEGDTESFKDFTQSAFWLSESFNIITTVWISEGLQFPKGTYVVSTTLSPPSGGGLCTEQGCW